MQIDPFAHDPGRWGASLATHAETVVAILDAARPRSMLEVGAYAGDVTRILLDWAGGSGARVTAIDPEPEPSLVELSEGHPELNLIRKPSHEALPGVELPDAAIIDGDHNYYTVHEELRLIGNKANDAELPLLLLHDVCWPHARRDSYFAPELIPEEHRNPMVQGAGLFPGEPGLKSGGLPFTWAAEEEGGPANGVLTAIEDFVAERDGLQLAIVPAFFGLGVVWHREAPWSEAVAGVVERFDRNPLLERLEANRVYHLASVHVQMVRAAQLEQRAARQEALLRELLKSKSFSVAERISRLRQGGKPAFSKDDVRRVLAD
jgi:Methyltransferase domain